MSRRVSACALGVAVACVFNTLLAWAKDAYAPLNTFLGALMGHHWVTHGVADLVVFAGMSLVLMRSGAVSRWSSERVTSVLVWCVAGSGFGLLAWYFVF